MEKHSSLLSCIEISPDADAVGTVILLHGLGADGNDFTPMVPELNLPSTMPLRFIFPNAPLKPITINNGYVMRAWYDVVSFSIDQRSDKNGITESVMQLNQLIEHEEQRGIPSNKIVLAGFSQGSVIALTAGLSSHKPLAGILALSGYLPFAEELILASPSKSLPIFMAHGTQDPIIPYPVAEAAYKSLKSSGFNIEWHSYPMAHSVCPQEIGDIAAWIKLIYTPKS